MIDGNPEFSDIVYDFIKARYPSASKFQSMNGNKISDIEIFIDGRFVCYVGNFVWSRDTSTILPTDPQLFDKLIGLCGLGRHH